MTPIGRAKRRLRSGDRARGPLRAPDRNEAVLRMQERIRRGTEHPRVPGVPWVSRGRCRCSTRAQSSSPCGSGRRLNCDIRSSRFDRKNYFYPDMPKDYQISQYAEPINVGGYLDLPDGTRVGIVRAHIEEDTGKTTHMGGGGRIHDADYSLVDYNRAGVPAGRDRVRARHPQRRAGASLRGGAPGHPRRDRCVGRAHGGGLDACRRQRLGEDAPGRPSSAPGAR